MKYSEAKKHIRELYRARAEYCKDPQLEVRNGDKTLRSDVGFRLWWTDIVRFEKLKVYVRKILSKNYLKYKVVADEDGSVFLKRGNDTIPLSVTMHGASIYTIEK
jgi:hypothetical protein